MSSKGKNLPHHPQSNSHIPSQHSGFNVTHASTTHVTQGQHFNTAIVTNSTRFRPHIADFHSGGQNFVGQSTPSHVGTGSSIAGRNQIHGALNPVGQTITVMSPANATTVASSQSIGVNNPTSSANPAAIHMPKLQDMSKTPHMANPTPSIPVFVPSSTRPSQNYFCPGPRHQQPRNVQHRGQVGSQSQVLNISSVNTTGQPMYTPGSVSIQPPIYLPSQVPNLHANQHQQNLYTLNSTMMQFSGPPQRHQQSQFHYPAYPALIPSNPYGFSHGAQPASYIFHQTPGSQLNVNSSGSSNVNTNNPHIAATLSSSQNTMGQGPLQQATQSQPIHQMSTAVSLPQNEAFSNYSSVISQKSKKLRDNAIIDIVDPSTGKNISADIYQNKAQDVGQIGDQSVSSKMVAADFAARVAKVASESTPKIVTFCTSNAESKKDSSESESIEDQCFPRTNLATSHCSKIDEVMSHPDEQTEEMCKVIEVEESRESSPKNLPNLSTEKVDVNYTETEIASQKCSSFDSDDTTETFNDVDIADGIERNNISLDGRNFQKQKLKKLKSRDFSRRGNEKSGIAGDPIKESKDETLTGLNKDFSNENLKETKDTNFCKSECKETNASPTTNEKVQPTDLPKEHDIVDCGKPLTIINRIFVAQADRTFLSCPNVEPHCVEKRNENIVEDMEATKSEAGDDETVTAKESIDKTYNDKKRKLSLKYTYIDGQWSPLNTGGRKIYDREFLMKLQNDPNSKIKPCNLPDLDVVLKDSNKNRVDFRYKDHLSRHDSLFPGFLKPSINNKVVPLNKKSHSGKPKTSSKPSIHYYYINNDIKLRETENAWKPTRLAQCNISEEELKTEALYKRVRSVLNKLTPQKFDTLVNQVRDLQIDTQERLQGVIDLVFEKAVDEPNFSVAYALMCKELATMEVTGAETDVSANFRKLILTRCQTEFEKNTVDENARSLKLKEIEQCSDAEKRKELQLFCEEEERRLRIKSVGNIRFIGELFKQNMLTSKIMEKCIRHLLSQVDEENLECLCKLLTTIGKALELKSVDLSEYFKQMQMIATNKKGKISSRIRFMLQDVIDLRANKWVPRRDESNPKTMDQIQKEAENERLDIQLNNTNNNSRKDDRSNERKRNRGGLLPTDEGGWSQPISRTRQVYSVETSKLKSKPPSMDDMTLGSRTNYQWSTPKMVTPNKYSCLEKNAFEQDKKIVNITMAGRPGGLKGYDENYKQNHEDLSKSENKNLSAKVFDTAMVSDDSILRSESHRIGSAGPLDSKVNVVKLDVYSDIFNSDTQMAVSKLLDEYVAEGDEQETVKIFGAKFTKKLHSEVVREIINLALEKSDMYREKASILLASLLANGILDKSDFISGLAIILDSGKDLIIDIPRLWKYVGEILAHPVINEVCSFRDLETLFSEISDRFSNQGVSLEIIGELINAVRKFKDHQWILEKWNYCCMQLTKLSDDPVVMQKFVVQYSLQFLSKEEDSGDYQFGTDYYEEMYQTILSLLKSQNIDQICNQIRDSRYRGTQKIDFIRALMSAVLENCTDIGSSDHPTFKEDKFKVIQKLITRHVDANENLELQCLFAIQSFVHKLNHPPELLPTIMRCLTINQVLSLEAYLAWEKNDDPDKQEGKAMALASIADFLTHLKENNIDET